MNEVDSENRSPVMLAAAQKCWRCVEALLKLGADTAIRDNNSKNILHVIVLNGGSISDIIALKQAAVSGRLQPYVLSNN